MKKLIFVLSSVILLIIAGCGKETHTVSEEDNGTSVYKADIIEDNTGDYEVDIKEAPEGEMDYFEQKRSTNEYYLNETLPPLLQSVTDQTGITFTTSFKEVDRYSRIKVEVHRNGNIMENYELKKILPNLDSYKDSFVPDINIDYIQRDEYGDSVPLDNYGEWQENGEYKWK